MSSLAAEVRKSWMVPNSLCWYKPQISLMEMGTVIQAGLEWSEVLDGIGGCCWVALSDAWKAIVRPVKCSIAPYWITLSYIILWLICLWAFYSTNTMYDWKLKCGSCGELQHGFQIQNFQWTFTKTSTIRCEEHKQSTATRQLHYLESTQGSGCKNYSF